MARIAHRDFPLIDLAIDFGLLRLQRAIARLTVAGVGFVDHNARGKLVVNSLYKRPMARSELVVSYCTARLSFEDFLYCFQVIRQSRLAFRPTFQAHCSCPTC